MSTTTPTVNCARCGIKRVVNHSRFISATCRDCRDVMTEDERRVWAA
jgi:ribosomal protein S27E